MKKLTLQIVCLVCVIGAVSAVLMSSDKADPPPELTTLRVGINHEEVTKKLIGRAFRVMEVRRTGGTLVSSLAGTEWLDLGGESNSILLEQHVRQLSEGQRCQLWDRKDVGIVVVFSADGVLLNKDYRYKFKKASLRRYLKKAFKFLF